MSPVASVRLLLTAALLSILSGCASGPKFAETSSSMPVLKTGDGRVFFYRSSSMVGAAVQPDVRLNGQVVGPSKPGGFFFVDSPAGSYTAAASTETEKTVSFQLDAGETKYVKMSVSLGLVVGRVVLSLESPQLADAELRSLSYVGTVALSAEPTAAPARATTSAATTRPVAAVWARPAVRLTFVDKDPISQSPLGETTLTLEETTSTQRVYNDGSLITAVDGTPLKGAAHSTMIYGIAPRDLQRGGTWTGMFRAVNVQADVPATFTAVGRQEKVVSGHRFEATRIRIEGYATRSYGQSERGAIFTGEALVDNATGLVLEIDVSCRHPSYMVRRELVRVSGLS